MATSMEKMIQRGVFFSDTLMPISRAKILLWFGIQPLGVSLTVVLMRILFLTPYPEGEAPSQRFRFEQYLVRLRAEGMECVISPFLDVRAWRILYKPGHLMSKTFGILRGYARRVAGLFSLRRYDAVFIHREASPFGPPWIEWLIARVFRKPVIFDFDDAIWIPNTSDSNRKLTAVVKSFSKTSRIIQWSRLVIAGNKYLADYARQYNSHVEIVPTTIDTVGHHNDVVRHENKITVIGWTGSHSTLPLLEELAPVLQRLRRVVEFQLRVVCDVPPEFTLDGMVFVPWSKQDEISELLKFNIGIMPLPDNEWTRGKCGFKALQYMAVGIPAVVSPVGVNAEIVSHGINGLHCSTHDEWFSSLEKLIRDRSYLIELATACRPAVEKSYSVVSQQDRYVSFFRSAVKP